MHTPLITSASAGTSSLDSAWRAAHASIPMEPAERDERGDHHWADSAAAALDSTPADYPDPTSPIVGLTLLNKVREKAAIKGATLIALIVCSAVASAAALITWAGNNKPF
jgi:hypothetical protein